GVVPSTVPRLPCSPYFGGSDGTDPEGLPGVGAMPAESVGGFGVPAGSSGTAGSTGFIAGGSAARVVWSIFGGVAESCWGEVDGVGGCVRGGVVVGLGASGVSATARWPG